MLVYHQGLTYLIVKVIVAILVLAIWTIIELQQKRNVTSRLEGGKLSKRVTLGGHCPKLNSKRE